MKALYLRPLRRPNTRNFTQSIAEFYDLHPPFKAPMGGTVLLVPSPITNAEDLELVIAKIREVAHA